MITTLATSSSQSTLFAEASDDCVTIRGRRIGLPDLVDSRLFDPDHRNTLRAQMAAAKPFPHLLVNGWFNDTLLELVREEFDLASRELAILRSQHEETYRSHSVLNLAPASQLYFGLVNSGAFVEFLADVAGVCDLLPDASLMGGGLHETRAGGTFGMHRDFDRHVRSGLRHELGFITYLNHDWSEDWHGNLELWGGPNGPCVRSVPPDFGNSILMRHGERSYHGHPQPLNPPAGRTRRSLASYYYSNPEAGWMRAQRIGTSFAAPTRLDRLKSLAQFTLPPMVWYALRRLRRG